MQASLEGPPEKTTGEEPRVEAVARTDRVDDLRRDRLAPDNRVGVDGETAVGPQLHGNNCRVLGQRFGRLLHVVDLRYQARLGRVREEDVGPIEELDQAGVPVLIGVPVGVDRRRRAASVCGVKQRRQVLLEGALHEIRTDVHVPCRVDEIDVDARPAEVRDGARRGQDGAVIGASQDHRETGWSLPVHAKSSRVDPLVLDRSSNERSEQVVADDAGKRHPEPEPGGSAGQDGSGTAEHQSSVFDDRFDLSEGRSGLDSEDQVGIRVAEHQQVDALSHRRSVASAHTALGAGSRTRRDSTEARTSPTVNPIRSCRSDGVAGWMDRGCLTSPRRFRTR